jgi:hypothetical protein
MEPTSYINWPTVFGTTKLIPERFINSDIEDIRFEILGEPVKMTSGFMEPSDTHSAKPTLYAIFDKNPKQITEIPPGYYNVGIDYVVLTPDQSVRTWYTGVVTQSGWEEGYGYRVRIRTDITFRFNGKDYPVYMAYAHLDNIDAKAKEGDRVFQGQRIGEMGGTGKTPPYDQHVDLQIWVKIDGKDVNVSPNVLVKQLLTFPGLLSQAAIAARDAFGNAEQQSTPLVLDLDGDGIELTSVTDDAVVRFDMDMDGLREATGWVNADDGLLVFDRNGDNLINDLSELFGTQVQGESGFNVLRQLDSNQDNWISAADAAFTQLQVWRDLNQDGYSDSDELFSLSQLGISRIQVTFTKGNQVVNGNTITDFAT